jgi:hypothetical protein
MKWEGTFVGPETALLPSSASKRELSEGGARDRTPLSVNNLHHSGKPYIRTLHFSALVFLLLLSSTLNRRSGL